MFPAGPSIFLISVWVVVCFFVDGWCFELQIFHWMSITFSRSESIGQYAKEALGTTGKNDLSVESFFHKQRINSQVEVTLSNSWHFSSTLCYNYLSAPWWCNSMQNSGMWKWTSWRFIGDSIFKMLTSAPQRFAYCCITKRWICLLCDSGMITRAWLLWADKQLKKGTWGIASGGTLACMKYFRRGISLPGLF